MESRSSSFARDDSGKSLGDYAPPNTARFFEKVVGLYDSTEPIIKIITLDVYSEYSIKGILTSSKASGRRWKKY